jgi:hypothetical protein
MPSAMNQEARLLRPVQHHGAVSVHSSTDQANESDSDDDGVVRNARSSAEIRRHDQEVLEDEAETAQLLSGAHEGRSRLPSQTTGEEDHIPLASLITQKFKSTQKEGRQRHHDWGQENETVYELEGGPLTDSSASRSSWESDLQRLKGAQSEKKRRRVSSPVNRIQIMHQKF